MEALDELSVWRAERQIGRVIQSYARGIDGRDFARVRSCFHPDARIRYGDWFEGGLDAAIAWLEASLSQLGGTLHAFGPPWIEFDAADAGPVGALVAAKVETHAINAARYPANAEGILIQNVSGTRYFDQFECRAGVWAIRRRRNERVWTRNEASNEDPPLPVPSPSSAQRAGGSSDSQSAAKE